MCNVANCKKVRKGSITSTGNYMDHIRKSHPELVAEVEHYKKQGDCAGEADNKARKQQKTIQHLLKNFTSEQVCTIALNIWK